MNNNLLQIKITQRLNKLSSKDYDNIEPWKIMEAFNKAQLEWVRRQVYGLNSRREGSEISTGLVDDLQVLMRSETLTGKNLPDYFEAALPADYLYYVRVDAFAQSDCCPERRMTVYEAEEANVGVLITHEHHKPSYEWAETFSTLVGGNLRVYTAGEFDISTARLTYYRAPRKVAFLGAVDPGAGTAITQPVECEFKDDITEILIDETAAVLAGDLEMGAQIQREVQNAQRNT